MGENTAVGGSIKPSYLYEELRQIQSTAAACLWPISCLFCEISISSLWYVQDLLADEAKAGDGDVEL